MKRIIEIAPILLLSLLTAMPVWGQEKQETRKLVNKMLQKKSVASQKQDGNTLSKAQLEQATCLEYYADNGSVPPEYHYSYSITVKQQSVRLVIKKGYSKSAAYDKSASLSSTQFQQLKSALASQNIRKKQGEYLDGASTSSLKVLAGTSVLFQGSEGEDMAVGKGSLSQTFLNVLPPAMKNEINKLEE